MPISKFSFDPETSVISPINAVNKKQNDLTQAVELSRVLVEIFVLQEHASPNHILEIDLHFTGS